MISFLKLSLPDVLTYNVVTIFIRDIYNASSAFIRDYTVYMIQSRNQRDMGGVPVSITAEAILEADS